MLFFVCKPNVAVDQKRACNICTIVGMTNILSIVIPPLPVCSHTSPFSCHLCALSHSFLAHSVHLGRGMRECFIMA